MVLQNITKRLDRYVSIRANENYKQILLLMETFSLEFSQWEKVELPSLKLLQKK
jgi:hypothetical protein